jgi:signal transduction histidine kinase
MRMALVKEARTHEAQRLQTLHAINRGILAAESVQDIARVALSRIRALVPCDRAALGVFDWTTRESVVFAVDIGAAEPDTTGVRYSMDDLAEMLDRISNSEPFLIEDMSFADPLPPVLERYRDMGMRSNLQLALSSVERPIGLLSIMSSQPGAFSPEDVEIAAEVAGLLAIAIQQSEARAAAIQHERMKTELLNVLAHELFTPIATIQGTALTLLRAEELPKEVLGELRVGVEEAARRLKRLVRNINASVLLDKWVTLPVPVSLAQIFEHARAELPSDGRIELQDDARVLERNANVDLTLVSHAMVILLENALDFSDGQAVEVTYTLDEQDRVEILVSDRGPGIPTDRRERVFDLFEQVDSSATRSHEGLGIGLFLARRIARTFGGDIDIVPTEGDGVTFRLSLPLEGKDRGRDASWAEAR